MMVLGARRVDTSKRMRRKNNDETRMAGSIMTETEVVTYVKEAFGFF